MVEPNSPLGSEDLYADICKITDSDLSFAEAHHFYKESLASLQWFLQEGVIATGAYEYLDKLSSVSLSGLSTDVRRRPDYKLSEFASLNQFCVLDYHLKLIKSLKVEFCFLAHKNNQEKCLTFPDVVLKREASVMECLGETPDAKRDEWEAEFMADRAMSDPRDSYGQSFEDWKSYFLRRYSSKEQQERHRQLEMQLQEAVQVFLQFAEIKLPPDGS